MQWKSDRFWDAKWAIPVNLVIAKGHLGLRGITLILFGGLEFVALHLPLDAHQKIEVHALSFEPALERLAGIGPELDEHFAFEHVDEHAFGARRAAGLHALRERFGTLAREAGKRVLREVAWHRGSSKERRDASIP